MLDPEGYPISLQEDADLLQERFGDPDVRM